MNVALEVVTTDAAEDTPVPRAITMMPPKDLLESLFGSDVNPPATAEEQLSLKESIAEFGIQVPLTAGRVGGKGKYTVVKGTRRHAVAIDLGLPAIPVECKDYASLEDMRQDALRDNLERRQLSIAGRAALANTLWRSFDTAVDKKEMAAKGISPRKRAATASSLSEGTLAAYRYVLDSGNAELIKKMESGDLSIHKACNDAKKLTEGKTGSMKTAPIPSTDEQMKALRDVFEALVLAQEIIRDICKRRKEVIKQAKKGQINDPASLVKQIQAVNQTVATLASNVELRERQAVTSTGADSYALGEDAASN